MRQLVQPDGIGTSTDDADKLTGSVLVVTLEGAALAEKVLAEAASAGMCSTARLTEVSMNSIPILFVDRMANEGFCLGGFDDWGRLFLSNLNFG